MSQIEKEIKKLIYSKEVSPSEIVWLLLGLPVKSTDGNEKHLKLNIANTILFGFGNFGIHLKTNEEGYINWYFIIYNILLNLFLLLTFSLLFFIFFLIIINIGIKVQLKIVYLIIFQLIHRL